MREHTCTTAAAAPALPPPIAFLDALERMVLKSMDGVAIGGTTSSVTGRSLANTALGVAMVPVVANALIKMDATKARFEESAVSSSTF